MKNKIVCIGLLLSILSCSKHKVGKFVVKQLDTFPDSTFVIDLEEILQCSCDRVIFIGGIVDDRTISDFLGINYKGSSYGDVTMRLFVISDSNVVYQEDFNLEKFDIQSTKYSHREDRTIKPKLRAYKRNRYYHISIEGKDAPYLRP